MIRIAVDERLFPTKQSEAERMEAMMTPIRSMHASQWFQFKMAHLALGASFALLAVIVLGLL